ncbi:hypothetical protein PR048_029315 [Dryococelus australis]|uniref:Uncharacterized protein n=1 Tax=Dryococelus australis TaxID=614101 RepID=A0ABQ9GD27_9NEOP|nr:hypothetical protein PR048_029315 [Dryococelus australis]
MTVERSLNHRIFPIPPMDYNSYPVLQQKKIAAGKREFPLRRSSRPSALTSAEWLLDRPGASPQKEGGQPPLTPPPTHLHDVRDHARHTSDYSSAAVDFTDRDPRNSRFQRPRSFDRKCFFLWLSGRQEHCSFPHKEHELPALAVEEERRSSEIESKEKRTCGFCLFLATSPQERRPLVESGVVTPGRERSYVHNKLLFQATPFPPSFRPLSPHQSLFTIALSPCVLGRVYRVIVPTTIVAITIETSKLDTKHTRKSGDLPRDVVNTGLATANIPMRGVATARRVDQGEWARRNCAPRSDSNMPLGAACNTARTRPVNDKHELAGAFNRISTAPHIRLTPQPDLSGSRPTAKGNRNSRAPNDVRLRQAARTCIIPIVGRTLLPVNSLTSCCGTKQKEWGDVIAYTAIYSHSHQQNGVAGQQLIGRLYASGDLLTSQQPTPKSYYACVCTFTVLCALLHVSSQDGLRTGCISGQAFYALGRVYDDKMDACIAAIAELSGAMAAIVAMDTPRNKKCLSIANQAKRRGLHIHIKGTSAQFHLCMFIDSVSVCDGQLEMGRYLWISYFPSPLHSGTAACSPHLTLIGSEDLKWKEIQSTRRAKLIDHIRHNRADACEWSKTQGWKGVNSLLVMEARFGERKLQEHGHCSNRRKIALEERHGPKAFLVGARADTPGVNMLLILEHASNPCGELVRNQCTALAWLLSSRA